MPRRMVPQEGIVNLVMVWCMSCSLVLHLRVLMRKVVVEGAVNKGMTMDVVGMVVEKALTGLAGLMLPQDFGAKVLKRAPLAPGVASNPLQERVAVVVVVWVIDIVKK